MNTDEKAKLKHDFLNSIVIINGMTKSATNFFSKLIEDNNYPAQVEKFLYSMNAIREQTAKIEIYFESLLNQ